jgi:selenocysteine lyase/cysteine desulfurase
MATLVQTETRHPPRRAPQSPDPSSPLAALFAPLSQLLSSGGDVRLETKNGLNKYGCRAIPDTRAIAFSSSTASTISARGYDAVDHARERLLQAAIAHGLESAFEARIDVLRGTLKTCLGLENTGCDVVFSPSGTDSQLQALFLARALLGQHVTSIVVGADQTGSGTAHTARGRHFSGRTALGVPVETGTAITGLAEHVRATDIAFFGEDGAEHSAAAIDALVIDAVARAVSSGQRVLLQTMESSKLGRRGPSSECLRTIRARWPDEVLVVVDACQLRVSCQRLKEHLAQGAMVLITGSKFFGGPAFSGALLVPQPLSLRLKNIFQAASGLFSYATRYDWPSQWSAIRAHFPAWPNFGAWLRWEAALSEMRAYFAVPASFRRAALLSFAATVPEMLAATECLELLPAQAVQRQTADDTPPTIFPFIARRNGRVLSVDEASKLYRALGQDLSHLVPENAPDQIQLTAARICRVGQPVRITHNGTETAVLRISASARFVSDAWSPDGDQGRRAIARSLEDVATIVAKIQFVLPRLHAPDLELPE